MLKLVTLAIVLTGCVHNSYTEPENKTKCKKVSFGFECTSPSLEQNPIIGDLCLSCLKRNERDYCKITYVALDIPGYNPAFFPCRILIDRG